jgi:phage-related protein
VTLQDLLRFEEQQRARSRAALDELARIDRELGL